MKNKVVTPKENRIKKANLLPLIIVVAVILAIYAFTVIFVLSWGLLTSLKARSDFVSGNILGLPNISASVAFWQFAPEDGQSLEQIFGPWNIFMNYKLILQSFAIEVQPEAYYSSIFGLVNDRARYSATFVHYIFNSIFYSLVGSFLSTFMTMTVAYATSKYRFKFSGFLYTYFLITMTIPLVGVQTSTTALLKNLALYDTYWAMALMQAASCAGLYFFVFFGTFRGISDTFTEAAEIDGASQLSVYLRIMVPLALKIFGTVFLINFIATWNNYDAPMLYYPSEPTLSYAIYRMSMKTDGRGQVGQETQNICTRVAGCMILAIPVFVLFMALKNVILGNLSVGGIKE